MRIEIADADPVIKGCIMSFKSVLFRARNLIFPATRRSKCKNGEVKMK
jgi:hypothetical protein